MTLSAEFEPERGDLNFWTPHSVPPVFPLPNQTPTEINTYMYCIY